MNSTALQNVRELLGGETFPDCQSASLRLEKFVRLGDNIKKAEIDAVVGKTAQPIPRFLPKGGVQFTAALGGRLIVNQAGGVLENAGLCLHQHFNAPYIPGSAVKGCARHAAWQVWDETEEGEAKIAAAKKVAEIFGFPTGDVKPKDSKKVESGRVYLDDYLEQMCGYKEVQSGKVAFLDAVPETMVKLVVDVVTCHHPKYYAGGPAKAFDDEEPIPCPFPAVEKGGKFVFTLVPSSPDADIECAVKFLKRGLSQNGIGAKTSAGYGWFDIPEDRSSVEVDDSFLGKLESEYLDGKGKVREAFKKAYKKGEIPVDDDPRRKAVCVFLAAHGGKIGGEWQKDIERWSEQYGVGK